MDLDVLTGAGGTIEVGGRLLTIRQLNGADMGALQAFVKERSPRPMSVFIEEMKELAPLRDIDPEGWRIAYERLLDKAHEAHKAGANGVDMLAIADGLDAVAYTIWLSVRAYHPDVTWEWVKSQLSDADLPALKRKLDFANAAWRMQEETEEAVLAGTLRVRGNPPGKAPLPA